MHVFSRVLMMFCSTAFLSMIINHSCTASLAFPTHAWSSLEYLYWWGQDSPLAVPLITKNNNSSALGLINEPGTQIIFGSGSNNNTFHFVGMPGARLTIGGWLDDSNQYGLEGSCFKLSQANSSFSASSVGGNIPVINIPFFDTRNKSEDVLIFKRPNTASVSDGFQPWGFELNGLYQFKKLSFPVILLMGLRYLNLSEDLTLNDASFNVPHFPNSVLNVRDNFSTKNYFYGFQIGARTHFIYQKFLFDITSLLALGENFQKLIINGETNFNDNIVLQSIGLFAEPSNIGTFYNHQFSIVPELRAKVGYSMSRFIHPFVAYNCFYINNIIRPGEQIDRNINLSQNSLLGGTGVLTGARLPFPGFNNSSMWLQGLSAGVELVF